MFRMIIENAPVGVLVVDEHGTVVFCNKSAEAIFLSSGGKLAGAKISSILPGTLVVGGDLLLRIFHPDAGRDSIALHSIQGGVNKYEIRQSAFVNDDWRWLNIVMFNDATSWVDAENALKAQEKRWNLALQGSQIGVFESDLRKGTGIASDTW
ncbi:MAG: PAS domain-containing protein [Phaeovulum sp.]|uniref:PAS domain-containing protein n=1 Tax=Phaeovulum sp. TaxID=2934796 RepID=UPI00272F12BF|nr:PAS domain-containing protein [Phaeovulum sp.]MDP2062066.1 PAS domain-containing protein [Phaeovulum sp.]